MLKKLGMIALTLLMMIPCGTSVWAATANNRIVTDVKNDLVDKDMIDDTKKGSLSIVKYDMTAAAMGGVDVDGLAASSGKADSNVENTMSDYAVAGVGFTYLRTGNVETYTRNGDVRLVYEIPVQLAGILDLHASDAWDTVYIDNGCITEHVYHYTSQQVNDAMKEILEADDEAAKDKLETWIAENKDAVAMPLTDEKGMTSKDNLDLGLYLVVETSVPENITETVNPWFVQLPMTTSEGSEWFYDVTVYPKNQSGNPTLDKMVRKTEISSEYAKRQEDDTYGDTTTASEGDVLDYRILSKLPHISSKATYLTTYVFTDILSEGLTYQEDVRIAIYKSQSDAFQEDIKAAVAIWDTTSNAHSEQYAEVRTGTNKTGETQMTITVTDVGLQEINEKYSDYYLVIYYTARMNSDATAVSGDEGNPNRVQLKWERTSQNYYHTLEDETIVYTYGIHLLKNFSDQAGDAENVQFVLYNTTDGYYVIADEKGTDVEGRKIYYVTGRSLDKSAATILSPDKNGALVVNGIEGDDYSMTEVATDTGYSLLKEELVIHISPARREIRASVAGWTGYHKGQENGAIDMFVGELEPSSASVNSIDATLENYVVKTGRIQPVDSANALVDITVINSKAFLLPKTGGRSLYVITILGVVAIACGCIVIFGKNKKHE